MVTYTGTVQRQNATTNRIIIPSSEPLRQDFGIVNLNWQVQRSRFSHINPSARDAWLGAANGVTALELNGTRFSIDGWTFQSSKNLQFSKSHPITEHLNSLSLEAGDALTLSLIY